METELGTKIKKRRKELLLTQRDLAGDNFTTSYISQIEKGKLNPSLSALTILSKKLQIPISYLLNSEPKSMIATIDTDTINKFIYAVLCINKKLQSIDSSEAINQIEQLKVEMREVGLEMFTFLCDYSLVSAYFNKEQYTECINRGKPLLDSFEFYDMADKLAEMHYMIGFSQYNLQNNTEAKYNLHKCIQYIQDNHLALYDIDISAHIKLGSVFGKQGAYIKAYQYYQNALLKSKQHIGECYLGLGLCSYYLNDDVESLEYLNKAFALFGLVGYEYGVALAGNNIGMAYIRMSKLDDAIPFFQGSVDIYRKLKKPINEARSLHELATIYLVKENHPETLKYCRLMSKIIKRTDDTVLRAYLWHTVGKVLKARKKYSWALIYLNKAANIYETQNMPSELADIYSCMSEISRLRGDIERSLEMLHRSVSIYSKLTITNQRSQ